MYAHIDADFPLVYLNDATLPNRISDHDPAVAYFKVPAIQGTVQLVTSVVLSKVEGGYQAIVTVKNNGTGTAQSVQLTGATMGNAIGTPLPAVLGDIAPGGTASLVETFQFSAGASGVAAAERYTGTYTGGTFGSTIRAILPDNK